MVPAQTQARTGAQRVDAVTVELIADRASVARSGQIELALRLAHEPGWHTYWRNSGDSGLPTTVEPSGPAQTLFGPLRWPAPKRMWVGPLANYGYEGEVALPFQAQLPAALPAGTVRFEAFAQWLVCREVCVPGEARVALELPQSAPGEGLRPSAQAALFQAMSARIPDPARALPANLFLEARTASLTFDAAALAGAGVSAQGPQAVEFFPYVPGEITPAAQQSLLRTSSGWRIDLQLAEDAKPPARMQGLLWVDDRPIEVQAQVAVGPPPDGRLVFSTPQPVASATTSSSDSAASGPGRLLQAGTPAASADRVSAPSVQRDSATSASGWLASLALGLIGGLLLNLMPCVFPVIGLKVLGFAQASPDAPEGRRAMRQGGFAFAGGVLVSFWLLGGLMLALRAAGDAIGWGFQLQSPGFVAAMALLFVLIGLNFSGVFEIGLGLTRLGNVGANGSADRRGPSLTGSFGAGVLAAAVATPCTAPFMGSALGLTLSQPPAQAMAVFTAIGLGMALPYALLGVFPAWLRVLPRPGRWMETLRQVLAFPMYASAVWLTWVLAQQAGADAMLRLLLAAVLLAAAAWAWGRFSGPPRARPGLALSLVIACAAGMISLLEPVVRSDQEPAQQPSAAAPTVAAGDWEPWSEARVAAALAAGKPVFIDFTAAWCVTCQANKRLVLERPAVTQAFEQAGVVRLRADWTRRDALIAAELARHGRNGVPLYLLIRPGQREAHVLPEVLTVAGVLEALTIRTQ
jgi:thiol:disulfide interchange protein DsbD